VLQVLQIGRAGTDVDHRIAELDQRFADAEALGGGGHDLHQAARALGGDGGGVTPGFHVHDGAQQVGVDVVVAGDGGGLAGVERGSDRSARGDDDRRRRHRAPQRSRRWP
jgi:hypothetical protein